MQGKWREFELLSESDSNPIIHDAYRTLISKGELRNGERLRVIEIDAYTHLKAENERLQREANQAVFEREKSASDHVKKYEALQTQNAKLKAALEKILNSLDAWHQFHDSDGLWKSYHSARTTLAEIGGDDA